MEAATIFTLVGWLLTAGRSNLWLVLRWPVTSSSRIVLSVLPVQLMSSVLLRYRNGSFLPTWRKLAFRWGVIWNDPHWSLCHKVLFVFVWHMLTCSPDLSQLTYATGLSTNICRICLCLWLFVTSTWWSRPSPSLSTGASSRRRGSLLSKIPPTQYPPRSSMISISSLAPDSLWLMWTIKGLTHVRLRVLKFLQLDTFTKSL